MTEPLSVKDYSEPTTVAAQVALTWSEWNNVRSVARSRWEEIDAYIHATDTSNLEGGSNFDHKTHIPLVSQLHEELKAIVYGTVLPHDDWLGWKPFDSNAASTEKREKVGSYMKHIHALNGFRKTMRKVIDDFCRYGNCFGQVVFTNESVQKEDGTSSAGYVGGKLNRISPYDIVFNPTADSFESSAKVIRSMMSIGGFRTWTDKLQDVNEEAVQKVMDRRSSQGNNSTSDSNKNQQYIPDGYGTVEQYYRSGYVEVLWFYGSIYDEETQQVVPNRMLTVIDGNTVLFDKEETSPRIFKGSWKPRPDNLWSQGALDNIIGINFMVNHRENAKNDAIDKFIYPDRLYAGDVEEIYDETTGQTKYLAPENGNVVDIRPDTTVLTFNNEIEMHSDIARMATTLPQQLSGFRTAGEKTAFEVERLDSGAFRGFINKAEQFEQEFLEPTVTAEIEVGKENFLSVVNVAKEDEDGFTSFLEITEEDLKSNGVLVPYGARRFARLLQQQAGLDKFFNSAAQGMTQAHTDTWKLAQAFEYTYQLSEFKLFGKFKSIEEQLEAQQVQTLAEQELVESQSQPTVAEQELAIEDEALQGGQDV